MSGKIITIEGNNGSGKQTQAKLLCHKVKSQKLKVNCQLFSYPEYETSTGAVISRYLKGDFGPKEDLFEFAALLYATDRVKNKQSYEQLLESGTIILNDRYKESSWAILGSLAKDKEQRAEKIAWMQELERDMPDSDLVIFLDMPWQTAYQLIEEGRVKNGQPMDTHEIDQGFLQRCEETYCELAEQFGWVKIDCVREGKLREKEEISEEVWALVREFIKK